MGMMESLRAQQMSPAKRDRDNIQLMEPVAVLFLGRFAARDIDRLSGFIGRRVGNSDRVGFAAFAFGKASETAVSVRSISGLSGSDPSDSSGKVITQPVSAREELSLPDAILPIPIPTITLERTNTLEARAAFAAECAASAELEQAVGDFAGDIYNRVARFAYPQAGTIRIHLIIQAESMEAALLETLTTVLRARFRRVYPERVRIDAYCLLDQREYRADEGARERKAFAYLALQDLERLAGSRDHLDMAFCLSNVDSWNRLNPDEADRENQLRSIGLMMIAKDGIPAEVPRTSDTYALNRESRYSDASFLANSTADGCRLFSLGYMHLDTLDDAAETVAYSVLLDAWRAKRHPIAPDGTPGPLELTRQTVSQLASSLVGGPLMMPVYMQGVVKDLSGTVSELAFKPRAEVLRSVFGSNLDLYFAFNNQRGVQERLEIAVADRISRIREEVGRLHETKHLTVFEIRDLLRWTIQSLRAQLAEHAKVRDGNVAGYQEWMSGREPVAGRIELAPGTKEPVAFLKLGAAWLDYRQTLLEDTLRQDLLMNLLSEIEKIGVRFEDLAKVFEDASLELEESLKKRMEGELDIRTGRYEAYYREVAAELLARIPVEWDAFLEELNADVCIGVEPAGILRRLAAWCGEHLLSSPCFSEEFSVEAVKRLKGHNGLVTENDIHQTIFATIIGTRAYHISVVKAGEMNSEICFFLNKDSHFVDDISSHLLDQRLQALRDRNGIKLFHEAEFKGMDILFMQGCFSAGAIHGFDAMRAAHAELTANASQMEPTVSGPAEAMMEPSAASGADAAGGA